MRYATPWADQINLVFEAQFRVWYRRSSRLVKKREGSSTFITDLPCITSCGHVSPTFERRTAQDARAGNDDDGEQREDGSMDFASQAKGACMMHDMRTVMRTPYDST